MSNIGEPSKFIVSEPAIDPLPKRVEQPSEKPQEVPEPEHVPAGGEE